MKKIRNAIYRSNEWYDDLPELKRFLIFLWVIGGSLFITQILLYVYNIWYAFPIVTFIFVSWRIIYFKRRKKTYSYDIETNGLGYDHVMAIKFIENEKKRKKEGKDLE